MSMIQKLTQRELEVLGLIVKCYSDNEICKKLVISKSTVKAHKSKIYFKFGLSPQNRMYISRLKAVLIYLKETGKLKD